MFALQLHVPIFIDSVAAVSVLQLPVAPQHAVLSSGVPLTLSSVSIIKHIEDSMI